MELLALLGVVFVVDVLVWYFGSDSRVDERDARRNLWRPRAG